MNIIRYLENKITERKEKTLKRADLKIPVEIKDFILKKGYACQLDTIKGNIITFYENKDAMRFFEIICHRYKHLYDGTGKEKWHFGVSQRDFWGSTIFFFEREQIWK